MENDVFIISDVLRENYEKALIDAGKFEKNRFLINDNLSYSNFDETLIETFEDNTTISVSEKGYGVAKIVGNYIEIIEVENGVRNEYKIDLIDIQNRINERNSKRLELKSEVTPMHIDYEEQLNSYMGYFSYYEMRGRDNYRSYTLTVPNQRDKVRGTSLVEKQPWELQDRNFLGVLKDGIYLGEDLDERLSSLASDTFDYFIDRVTKGKAVKAFLITAEVLYELGANGFKAAAVTAITSVDTIFNDILVKYKLS